MSKCMTIDEAIDQKETCTEITARDIVEFVLEEVLQSAVIVSDKGYSRIGDFNITEDFCQQFDQPRYLKDFERANSPSTTDQGSCLNFEEKLDNSANLKLILDPLVKEETIKTGGECRVISEELLADNELQIQNGQIHLEKNRTESGFHGAVKDECPERDNVLRGEKIEIEYYNEGKLNRIYVPLGDVPSADLAAAVVPEPEINEEETRSTKIQLEEMKFEKEKKTSFTSLTTEELKEVYPEEVSDPNRPRACATSAEEVKKMTREIEEMNFNQIHGNTEDHDMAYRPDGQGDVDLESKSLTTKSKETLGKTSKDSPGNPAADSGSFLVKSIDDLGEPFCGQKELEVLSSDKVNLELEKEEELLAGSGSFLILDTGPVLSRSPTAADHGTSSTEFSFTKSKYNIGTPEEENSSVKIQPPTDNIHGELHLEYEVVDEECLLKSRTYNESVIIEEATGGPVAENAFDISLPPEVEENLPASVILTKGAVAANSSTEFRIFRTDSENLAVDTNKNNGSLSFSSRRLPTCSSKLNLDNENGRAEFPSQEFYPKPEPKTYDDKRAEMRSRSVNDAVEQDFPLEPNQQTSQGVRSLGRGNRTNADEDPLNSVTFSKGFKSASAVTGRVEEQKVSPESSRESIGAPLGARHYGDDPFLLPEKVDDKLVNAISCGSKNLESVEITEDREKEKRIQNADSDIKSHQSNSSGSTSNEDDNRDVKKPKEPDSSGSLESSAPSGGWVDEEDDASLETAPANFKLHSQKMYSGVNFAPASLEGEKFCSTDSEEAFIAATESVLQVINPRSDDSEDSDPVSFSLLSESGTPFNESAPNVGPEDRPASSNDNSLSSRNAREEDLPTKKIFSGMTTIGPMKNLDYDPKDLTAPEIDFGKMTRIKSSRQLGKDIFASEIAISTSVKILEDDSDDNGSITLEGDRMEVTSLVNRDIASLTKVQKVREVMSYHPKPDEYFEDDDSLTRPRLDLKDVESMTDERYKVPDVSIPLLSFEVGDNTEEADKELLENMNIVLTGNCFSNSAFYEDDLEEDGLETTRPRSVLENECVKQVDPSNLNIRAQSSKSLGKKKQEGARDTSGTLKKVATDGEELAAEEDLVDVSRKDSHSKYGTLGSVFRKASSKFIRKDEDLLLRNSKSLPRDASKFSGRTDSIKSILDDCQTSATNVLKKSRSLLKNTQEIFKTISQSRFANQTSDRSLDKEKLSPSESQVHNMERKFSSLVRKEDFTKAKNLIKSKMEKTFRHSGEGSSASSQMDTSDQKDLRVAVRHEENLRVDRMENFRKLLPKSPLVYKSQFVKSQISVSNNVPEVSSGCDVSDNRRSLDTNSENVSGEAVAPQLEESEKEPLSSDKEKLGEEKTAKADERGDLQPEEKEEETEAYQPEYIVMETVQGLPTTDLENYPTATENQREPMGEEAAEADCRRSQATGAVLRGAAGAERAKKILFAESDVQARTVGSSNALQTTATEEGVYDISPCFPQNEEEKATRKPPSDRKMKGKPKTFTAKFRSFWCSAFGKVKSPPKKSDL